jgi:hypothetical protein
MIRSVSFRLSYGLGVLLFVAAGPVALAQPQDTQTQRPRSSPAQKPQTATKPAPASQDSKSTPAQAQKSADKKGAEKKGAGAKPAAAGPDGAQATLLANFGDWGAYASQQGRTKICYALSKPKDQQPKELKRGPAYLFVSFRPAENVRNEVAVVMGTAAQDGGAAEALVGTTTYALVTKDQNAWVKNPAEENQVVATMSKGQSLIVKAAGKRGGKLTDRYSLNGFGPALDRARKECS